MIHIVYGPGRHFGRLDDWIYDVAANRKKCYWELVVKDAGFVQWRRTLPVVIVLLSVTGLLSTCRLSSEEIAMAYLVTAIALWKWSSHWERKIVRIRYTSKEWHELSFIARNGIAARAALKYTDANLVQKAETLWHNTGDPDVEVAMAELGAWGVVEYLTNNDLLHKGRVKLKKISTQQEKASEEEVASPPNILERSDTYFVDGNMQRVAATVDVTGTTVTENDIVGVVGAHYNEAGPPTVPSVVIGPLAEEPNVYANTVENLEAAIEERINKKQNPCKFNPRDKERIASVIQASMRPDEKAKGPGKGIFTAEKINAWIERNCSLEEMKSKKWTQERLEKVVDELYAQPSPKYKLKAKVKAESMPVGKAPRMIIADGDPGQLMALLVIKCFEDLLFEHMHDKSIKHRDRRTAMIDVCKALSKPKSACMFFDGSAWDTTCTAGVRESIENPILRWITKHLIKRGVVPESWLLAHEGINEQDTLSLYMRAYGKKILKRIDAIRRSGHRGTSCLNWWVNFVMWVCSLFEDPKRFLDPTIRWGVCLDKVRRWFNIVLEGDDSLAALYPPVREQSDMANIALAFWDRGGFNIKAGFCTTIAEFCGYKFGCNGAGELTSDFCPDLPRAMAGAGISSSGTVLQAYHEGNPEKVKPVAAAAAVARAADFCGILPTVSRKFLEFADSLHTGELVDHEMGMRSVSDPNALKSDIVAHIEAMNGLISPEQEFRTLRVLGWEASSTEVDRFRAKVWSLEPHILKDVEGFKASLPASWRR